MRPEQVLATPLDVTNPSDVHQAIEDAVRRFGHVDVLVNNAGFGLFGALEELLEQDLRREFETNVFGALHAIRAVLPHFRARRSGHIVQVSSLEGLAPGLAAESAYAGSKFAMEGVCEGLAEELVDLGIRVTIVEPGPIRTEFGAAARVVPPAIADYDSSVGRALDAFAQLAGNQPNEPGLVARAIITAIESPEPPLRLVLGREAVQAVRGEAGPATRGARRVGEPGHHDQRGVRAPSDPDNRGRTLKRPSSEDAPSGDGPRT